MVEMVDTINVLENKQNLIEIKTMSFNTYVDISKHIQCIDLMYDEEDETYDLVIVYHSSSEKLIHSLSKDKEKATAYYKKILETIRKIIIKDGGLVTLVE